MRRRFAVVALLAATPGLVGCSFSFSSGSSTVDADEVAEQVVRVISPQIAQDPNEVTCPDALAAEVDASTVCVLALDGDELDVNVTVTSVEDDRANFDIECPDCVPAVSADVVAQQILDELEAQSGQRPSVTCPAGLPPKIGAELTCELVDGEDRYDVAVTATSVDGTNVGFDFQVGEVQR